MAQLNQAYEPSRLLTDNYYPMVSSSFLSLTLVSEQVGSYLLAQQADLDTLIWELARGIL